MAKKKRYTPKTNMTPVWIVLIVVVALVAVIGTMTFFGSATNTTTTTKDGKTATCDSTTSPDLLINAFDFENKGTAISDVFIYRKQGTTTWKAGTTNTNLADLEVGATYDIVLGINVSDWTDNAYGEMFSYTVKCQASDSIEKVMYNDEIETSLSATFYNKDADAGAQTFGAGDEYVVSLRLKAGSDEYFGNPTIAGNPNVLVLKFNQSEWDTPNSVYLADGTELARVSIPVRYDQQASGFTEYAFALPVVNDKELTVYLSLNADDTNAPSIDGTAYIYAGNYYVNKDANIMTGVEDEEGVAVGTDAPDSVPLDFTA